MEKEKFNKLIGEQMRTIRESKKMTQVSVAELLNMDPQNYSKYERGIVSPTIFWLHLFCIATDTEFKDFLWNRA